MSLRGLVIRQPHLENILSGRKTWEMRSQSCRLRGTVALIEKGSGLVVGTARIVDDLPPLSSEELRSATDRHRIPADEIPAAIEKGWVRPWVLDDVQRLATPVPYKHTSGGSWVKLTADEQKQVEAASGTTPQIICDTNIPNEVATSDRIRSSASLDGNRLTLNIEWDDERPVRRSRPWRTTVFSLQLVAALSACACLLIAAFHFFAGLFDGDLFRWKAFAWFFGAAFLMGLAGVDD